MLIHICSHCVAEVQLFKQCRNLSVGTVLQGRSCLSSVETYLPALWCSGAGCLSSVGTYLLGTVLHGCRLFKWCRNLSSGTVLQGRSCLSSVETYLPALWCSGAGCLSSVGTYLLGTVLHGCRLFKWGLNLPPWHCPAGVQVVWAVSVSTSWAG